MNWYARALEANEYPDNIVNYIEPMLEKDYHLLDIGCGIGTFAIPLAERFTKVTALDKSKDMLNYLKKRAAEKNLNKVIQIKLLDWNRIRPGEEEPESINAILSSYSGKEVLADRKSIEVMNELAGDLVMLFVPTERKRHSFQTDLLFEKLGRKERKHKVCFSDIKGLLNEMEIQFDFRTFIYNFGQPFTSFSDAVDFFSFHYHLKDSAEIRILKTFLSERLVNKNNKGYLWMDNFKTSTLIWWESSI